MGILHAYLAFIITYTRQNVRSLRKKRANHLLNKAQEQYKIILLSPSLTDYAVSVYQEFKCDLLFIFILSIILKTCMNNSKRYESKPIVLLVLLPCTIILLHILRLFSKHRNY